MIADLGMRMRMRMRVNLKNVLNGLEQWMGMVVDAKLSERARITRVPTPRKKGKTYVSPLVRICYLSYRYLMMAATSTLTII